MSDKAFLMDKEVSYHELLSDDGKIQKLYELQNKEKKEITEIPNGCTDIRCIIKNGARSLKIFKSTEAGRRSELTECDACIGIRLCPGVNTIDFSGEEEVKKNLLKRMSAPLSQEKKLASILDILRDAYLKCPEYPVSDILNEVITKRGCLNVGTFLQTYSYSIRYLEKIFKETMGIPVKKYAEIIKIQNAIQMIEDGHIEQCNSLDFYDQAHFIREFKYLTTATPLQFAKFLKIKNVF